MSGRMMIRAEDGEIVSLVGAVRPEGKDVMTMEELPVAPNWRHPATGFTRGVCAPFVEGDVPVVSG